MLCFPHHFYIKVGAVPVDVWILLIMYLCHFNHSIFQEHSQILDFLKLVVYAKCSHTVVFDISAVFLTLQRRHLWLWLANANLTVDYHNNIVKAVSFFWGGSHFIKYSLYGYYNLWSETWCL